MEFEKRVADTIRKYNMLSEGDTVVVGLSGGADSVALFKVMCAVRDMYKLNLHAAHVNHCIRGDEAVRDAEYSRKLAMMHNVEFHLLEKDIPGMAKELGISEEMAGRQVRYEFFNSIVPDCKIAVAHHKCDSVETTLINMIRGSSLNGLKGISPVNGNVIRPLIECNRSEIEAYLGSINTDYMTDSTNAEDVYTRNSVRNNIIPAMARLNPNVVSTIYDNCRILADDEDFISSVCNTYAERCISTKGDNVVLDFQGKEIHIAIKRRLVVKACEELSGNRRGISSTNIESVLSLHTGGRTSFCGIYAERSYDKWIFFREIAEFGCYSYNVMPPCRVYVPEIGRTYKFEICSREDVTAYEKGVIYLDADAIDKPVLRSRRDGDVFSPLGLGGRKKVKDFLIDNKIPRSDRVVPVLEFAGNIAAILCLRADEAYKIVKNTTKILKISEVMDNE